MQIVLLKIHNILSIKDAELKFDNSGLVLVDGWNFDDNKANGAGKTAIFNALAFGLYDKVPRKISATEIKRRKSKSGFVHVKIKIKNRIYEVIRERPKNVKFKKSGKDLDITQEEWESLLGLTYDQFLISMYTVQRASNKFIDLNDTAKKDFLLQLMNLNEFTACKKKTDQHIKRLQSELNDLTIELEKVKSQIGVYETTYTDIDSLKKKMVNSFGEQQQINRQIKELQLVPKPDLSRYDELQLKTQDKLNKLIRYRALRDQRYHEFKRFNDQIKSFDGAENCFNCGAPLDNEEAKKKHKENQHKIKDTMMAIGKEIKELDKKLEKEQQVRSLMQQIKEKKAQESYDYNDAQMRIQELSSHNKVIDNNYKMWEADVKRADEIQNKIKELSGFKNRFLLQIQQKKEQVEILQAVATIYAPTGAPAYILDSTVESFNDMVSEYVMLIWPNASYQLKSYKENKKGDVVAKFSETFINNDHKCSIGSLSGGEYRALSLAIDFAIIDILGKQFGMTLNPIILDEPFEGLDVSGRETVIGLLEKLAVKHQIWVIDHASEAKAMFTQIIRVEKKKGISVIVSDVI